MNFFEALNEVKQELEKAMHNDERGKFRRVGGKTIFIRSSDKTVTKGPEHMKGTRLVMKGSAQVSTSGMASDLGSPSAEVLLTGGESKRKKARSMDLMVKSIDDLIELLRSNTSSESDNKQ